MKSSKMLQVLGVKFQEKKKIDSTLKLDEANHQQLTMIQAGVKCGYAFQKSQKISIDETLTLSGARSNLQAQLDAIASSVNDIKAEHPLTLTEVLNLMAAHISESKHVSDELSNTVQDIIESGVTKHDLEKLVGISANTKSISADLESLHQNKISADGPVTLKDNLNLNGFVISHSGLPKHAGDLANKSYVDDIATGIKWLKEVQACTPNNINTVGLFEVDGYFLKSSDRVLVKEQDNDAQNGVYYASNGTWTKMNAVSHTEVGTAVYVENGISNGGSSWVRLDKNQFGRISNQAFLKVGSGLDASSNGIVSVAFGAGLTCDASSKVIVDILPGGGLMLSTDNKSQSSKASPSFSKAQLGLTETGVLAGTSNADSSCLQSYTIDAKGRVLAVGSPQKISPSFENVVHKPDSLSGYGIEDGINKNGDIVNGTLQFKYGASIHGAEAHPSINSSYMNTGRYGKSGDGKTHFGYNSNGAYINYLRGECTYIEGAISFGAYNTEYFINNSKHGLNIGSTKTIINIDGDSNKVFVQAQPTRDMLSMPKLKDIYLNGKLDVVKLVGYAPTSTKIIDGQAFVDLTFVLNCLGIIIDSIGK